MPRHQRKPKEKRPLDARQLRDLALHYVGRYATSKARLVRYLGRKINEVGWSDGEAPADLMALAQEFEDLGYISDAGYAQMRASGMAGRGYGHRRIEQDLRANGIAEPLRAHVLRIGEEDVAENSISALAPDVIDRNLAAITFARRKRIGPFAKEPSTPDLRRKQLAQMLRAGHDFEIARKLIASEPGVLPDL